MPCLKPLASWVRVLNLRRTSCSLEETLRSLATVGRAAKYCLPRVTRPTIWPMRPDCLPRTAPKVFAIAYLVLVGLIIWLRFGGWFDFEIWCKSTTSALRSTNTAENISLSAVFQLFPCFKYTFSSLVGIMLSLPSRHSCPSRHPSYGGSLFFLLTFSGVLCGKAAE